MPDNNSQRPNLPQLRRMQTPEQSGIRKILRTVGPLTLIAGLICTIVGGVSFFSSMNSMEPPHYFWLCFVGLPLMFLGFVLSQFGYMGAAARYVAGEIAPVAADATNYMANEAKDAVETVAKSAARGIVEGIEAGKAPAVNFCPHCGCPVNTNFQFCPKCGKSLSKL